MRRPTKNRTKKVIDDEDEEEVEETKTSPQKIQPEGTDRRTTAMHSEATSSHAFGGKEEDGSVKSLKRQKIDEGKAITPKVASPVKTPKPEEKKAASPKKPVKAPKKTSPAKPLSGNKRPAQSSSPSWSSSSDNASASSSSGSSSNSGSGSSSSGS